MLDNLAFDDVMLAHAVTPLRPEFVNLQSFLARDLPLSMPFISAAMQQVTEKNMAIAMAQNGGLGFIHAKMTAAEQAAQIHDVKNHNLPVGASITTGDEACHRASLLSVLNVDIVLVESLDNDVQSVLQTIQNLRLKYGTTLRIVAGNINHKDNAQKAIEAGADGLKITHDKMPTLDLIRSISAAAKPHKVPVMTARGIRHAGDIVKALAAGADCVMLGSLLVGTEESTGDFVSDQGRLFKSYRDIFKQNISDALQNSEDTEPSYGHVPYRGTVSQFLQQLEKNVKNTIAQTGNATLADLQKNAEFIRMSRMMMAQETTEKNRKTT